MNLRNCLLSTKIYLYGSRARGDYSPTSDIDLAIDCPCASKQDWLQIIAIIENADTLLKIDCTRLDEAEPELKKNILNQGILLYGRH